MKERTEEKEEGAKDNEGARVKEERETDKEEMMRKLMMNAVRES